ncbi:MAG TPA: phosphoribosyltransferase [Ktedonobacteraceae bacterium]|nr:phosphoribosyltransferase [Ktedonobacteraceae bacterium]
MLATALTRYANRPDVLVLGLPRGGVPVAFEVARALHAPLDVLVVRKLGVPGQEELAMGAIASGGVRVLNDDIVRYLALSRETIEHEVKQEQREVERREQLYRGKRAAPNLHERTVILVDDGMATGATMRAAVAAVRQQQPAALIVAVPAAATTTCEEFSDQGEQVVCLIRAESFWAVGFWYEHFEQTTDEEVRDLLAQAQHEWMTPPLQA